MKVVVIPQQIISCIDKVKPMNDMKKYLFRLEVVTWFIAVRPSRRFLGAISATKTGT